MGMEDVESTLAHQSVEAGGEENSCLNETGVLHEPIKFGTNGLDEMVKGEEKVSEIKYPKDAVDEWPEPKQIHSFWFVKYRSFEDQKLKAKFEQSDKELQKKHQSRSQLIEKLRERKGERAKIISELKALGEESKQYWSKIEEKRKEIEPLQQALGQLRGSGYGNRDRRSGLCSSEEELNDIIKSLQYRIQHESIPLSEEKQILREIKQLESTREKVVSNAAMREKIQESMGQKEALEDQVKLIGVDLDDVRKNKNLVKAKLKQLDEIKEGIDNEIKSLEEELTAATQKRDKTFENIHELRKQREEGNLPFYENRSLLIKAKELAAKKDVESLRDLCEMEVTKFFSLWSSTKAFREDYEKRILPSLDLRQLSRDGRIRNPGEQPIFSVEAATPAEAEVLAKGSVKQPKEHSSSPSQAEASLVEKVEKEKNAKLPKETIIKNKETTKQSSVEDEEEYYVPQKLQKDPPKVNEVDEQKLKEMRREEEIAKAKQALERKKRLAEKAAAKAAIKAQKEAEKKEKEREKRAKKKAGPSVATQEPEEQTEASLEAVAEPEKVEEEVETPVPEKNTERKNAVRYRKRPKGLNSLPKTLTKRKKATNYWMYALAAATALAVLLLAIVGYRYLL